jgi:hypothetical protein
VVFRSTIVAVVLALLVAFVPAPDIAPVVVVMVVEDGSDPVTVASPIASVEAVQPADSDHDAVPDSSSVPDSVP